MTSDSLVQFGNARVRRARCLVAFWEAGSFVIQNYVTNKQTLVSPLVAHMLQRQEHYAAVPELIDSFAQLPDAIKVIEQLVAQDVLVVEDSDVDRKDRRIDETWRWNQSVRFFHYGTQHVHFEDDLVAEREKLGALAAAHPPPSPYKDYPHTAVQLPASFDERTEDFWNVLRSRRTRRRFLREPISLHEFSTLVLWTWGETHQMNDPVLGPYLLKTSPSGGARHPIEVYPLINRVAGVEPGLYHYSVRRHALEPIRLGALEDLGVQLCAGQAWVRDAAVIFFMAAVVERNMWKYHQEHAYRVLLLDAGHLGQTFHLVATKLGLAPFTTAATNDHALEQALGLDGVTEIPLYAAAVGPTNT